MTFAETRNIIRNLEAEIGCYDWRETIENMRDCVADFEVPNFRFIHVDAIDRIQQEELESDTYILGCFNPHFLSEILGMSSEAIRKIQEASPEALGELVLASGKLKEVQEGYVSADGYGHHFAHYDHHEREIDGTDYLAFKI